MSAPTVAMVMIAKDEAANVERCFASFWDHVDEVVLADTGSKDGTVAAAEAFAEEKGEPGKLKIGHFEWCNDFAQARIYADSLATSDWLAWCDLDDILRGAENLRKLAAEAAPDLLSYICGYNYGRDPHGNTVCYLVRERLVRRGAGEWIGRVHESQLIRGRQVMVAPEIVEWVHQHPPDVTDSNERNLRILEQWVEEEPEEPRVVGYLGTELLIKNESDRAAELFERYLTLKTGWDEERAQIHRKLAMVRMRQGRYDEAIDTALEAVRLLPHWTDSYLTLAEAYHEKKEWGKAIEWAREVLRRGQPQTMLIINPLDYKLTPRMILSSALGQLGQIEEAITVAEEALAIVPDHIPMMQARQGWISRGQREATAQTFLAAARQLVNHDEQLKALRLIEDTVPHFAVDHPEVVALRSELRERLYPLLDPKGYEEHYRTGGSKPEDLTPDEKVDEIGNHLPRCAFLLDGLLEQMGEVAA